MAIALVLTATVQSTDAAQTVKFSGDAGGRRSNGIALACSAPGWIGTALASRFRGKHGDAATHRRDARPSADRRSRQ